MPPTTAALAQLKTVRFAEGGGVDSESDRAAFGIYPRQRARLSSTETKVAANEAAKFAADAVFPQDAVDLGMILMGGPLGRLGRKVGAGLIAAGGATEAEASPLNKLLKVFHGASRPFDGAFDVYKTSPTSIMGKGLNVSTEPAYPSQLAMRRGNEAPVVYEAGVPFEKYIQLEAVYPPESFSMLRKAGRNPLPAGEVTGEDVYHSLRGLPKTLIPDAIIQSGFKGIEYPSQGGRWFSIVDTEGVKDRLGKQFASGGLVSSNTYDPARIDTRVAELEAELFA